MTITPEYLRECLDYDPETGVFTWKERPREHFKAEKGWKLTNTQRAGKLAGSFTSHGYWRITFTRGGKSVIHIRAHRVAWAIMYGVWPEGDIDHINGLITDNRLCNLREATRSENARNMKLHQRNTSGVKGVSWHNSTRKWAAGLMHNGKHLHFGLFTHKSEAEEVVRVARMRIHGEFANHGDGHLPFFE